LLERFDRCVASFLGGFEATLGLGEVLLELAAELLLTLQRCLCLAAVELCCLSRGAFVGELTLERRAVLPGALFDPVGALAGGFGALLGVGGALLGFVCELVGALGVFRGSGGFPPGGASAHQALVFAQMMALPRRRLGWPHAWSRSESSA
jgi:hypothetical protein